jgi:hypothetical protein
MKGKSGITKQVKRKGPAIVHDNHCVCLLLQETQAEVKRLREALVQYADKDNWSQVELGQMAYKDCWNDYSSGWEVAEAALASKNKGVT